MDQTIDRYLKMLQSQDAAKRKEAIIALGKSGNKAALQPLSTVYKTESDPTLRELALKAGRHLQKTISSTAAAVEPEPLLPPTRKPSSSGLMFVSTVDEADEEPVASSKGDVPDWMHQMGSEIKAPKVVSDAQKKKARALVDQAVDAQVQGNQKKVLDLLYKALQTDPAIEKDSRAVGLIAMHLGVGSDDAAAALLDMYGSGKRRVDTKMGGDYHEIVDFMIEMAIWVIVLGLLMAGTVYLTLQNFDWDTARAAAETPEEAAAYTDAEQFFAERGLVIAAMMIGAGYGIFITIFSVIGSVYTWIIGMFIGGSGTMFTFVRLSFRALVIILIVSTVASLAPLIFSPGSSDGAALGFAPFAFGMMYMGYSIGKAHDFGTMMGCLNMIVAVAAFPVLCCLLGLIV